MAVTSVHELVDEGLMTVGIVWTRLDEEDDELWDEGQCLYAYADPETSELLYIGKADYQTVGQRLGGSHKEQLYSDLGVEALEVFQGAVVLEAGRRLSSELLGDLEALLIMEMQPPGNVAYTKSRPARPGMRVHCQGDWPWSPTTFDDD